MAQKRVIAVAGGTGLVPNLVVEDNDATSADVTAAVAAHAALTQGVHGLGSDWMNYRLVRGVSLCTMTPRKAGWFFEDFVEVSRWYKVAGGGAGVFLPVTAGAVPTVASLAAAVGVTEQYGLGVLAGYLDVPITQGRAKWYVAIRFQESNGGGGAAPADAQVQLRLEDAGGQYIQCGYDGPTDAAHYSATVCDGVNPAEPLISTHAPDHGWHDLEMWCNGADYFLSVDAETAVQLVPAHPAINPLYLRLRCVGGAAAGVTGLWDKVLLVTPEVG